MRRNKENTAHLRAFLHHRGGPGDPQEAISVFSGILSYFRFYFLEEIGWSLFTALPIIRKPTSQVPMIGSGFTDHGITVLGTLY